MSEDRRLAVLRAIVEDYVADPGAGRARKALVERHRSGVSPATIRNDMAALEEEGLHRPAAHQRRAGCRPTRATGCSSTGCRTVKPLSPRRGQAIQSLLDGAVDLDDVVDRTVRLLAQLTQQVAVVQYPSLTRSTVRHVELVPLGGRPAARRAHHRTPAGSSSGSSTSARDRRPRRLLGRPAGPAERGGRRPRLTEVRRPLVESLAERVRAGGPRRSCAPCSTRSRTPWPWSARSGSCSPARRTWPASGTDFAGSIGPGAGGARGAGGAAQAARREMADGHRRRSASGSAARTSTRARRDAPSWPAATAARARCVARLGVLGPTRMDYPDDDGRRARRRPLRVADPGVMIDRVSPMQTA